MEFFSPAPLEAACSHRPPCGGCPRFGEPGIGADSRAALDALARVHGLPDVSVVSGAMAEFRLRARLAIRGRLGSPKLGLFETGSHRVVTIPHCRVQHPLINRVAAVVRRALVECRLTSYSDKAHLGLVRHLQVVIERSTATAQVVIVANSATIEPLMDCLHMIRQRLGGELHSLWFNAHTEPTNVVLGPDFESFCGPATVVEHFGGASVHYPPGAFGQSNLEIAAQIIEHIRAFVPAGATVAEFYAGVGAIGLSLIDRVAELRMNEISPQSLAGLEFGLAALDAAERAKVRVFAGTAGDAAVMAENAQLVIADPPRKGLDAALIDALVERRPRRFVYVSCGLAALLKDSQRLTATGALRLTGLTAFNLMPFTEHVETVAVFESG